MTQPPLTRRIARIEREIGAQLFTRVPTGVELTDAGRVLLERSYRIVQLTEQAIERTRLAQVGEAGAIVVGYFGSVIFDLLPRLLNGFLASRPQVSLVLERAAKDVQAEAIRDGRMHIGFSRQYPHEAQLAVRPIASESLYVAVPSGHDLLEAGSVRLADVAPHPIALFPAFPRPTFADEVTHLFASCDTVPNVAVVAEDVVTALAYVATTGAVSIVPGSSARINLPGVEYLPLAGSQADAISCLYRAQGTSPLVEAFLDYLDDFGGVVGLVAPAGVDTVEDHF